MTLGQAAGALIAICTFLGMLGKYAIVKPIKAYIDHATAQISPTANGGLSLADANKTLMRIENRLTQHILNHDTPK